MHFWTCVAFCWSCVANTATPVKLFPGTACTVCAIGILCQEGIWLKPFCMCTVPGILARILISKFLHCYQIYSNVFPFCFCQPSQYINLLILWLQEYPIANISCYKFVKWVNCIFRKLKVWSLATNMSCTAVKNVIFINMTMVNLFFKLPVPLKYEQVYFPKYVIKLDHVDTGYLRLIYVVVNFHSSSNGHLELYGRLLPEFSENPPWAAIRKMGVS